MANVKKITIIGCGPGNPEFVTEAARRGVEQSDCIIGSARLQELFPVNGKERVVEGADVQKALDAISNRVHKMKVAVLVSGDPGIYSLAKNVIKKFGIEMCEVVPGVSAVQCAFAKVGLDWHDYELVSAHAGAPEADFARLARKDKLAVLAGTNASMQWTAECAKKIGGGRRIIVCENLTLPGEKIAETTEDGLDTFNAASLTIVLMIKKETIK